MFTNPRIILHWVRNGTLSYLLFHHLPDTTRTKMKEQKQHLSSGRIFLPEQIKF